MSISPLALALIGAIGITAVISLWHNWQQSGEIERLNARHVRPANGRLLGSGMPHRTAPRRPDTEPSPVVSTSLLAPVRHADAMRQAAEPYMPPPPVRADLPMERTETAGHPPWTGEFPAVGEMAPDLCQWHGGEGFSGPPCPQCLYENDAQAELARVDWVRSQLPEREEDVTREDMERALASLRAVPVHGERCVTDVLEAERQAKGLIA